MPDVESLLTGLEAIDDVPALRKDIVGLIADHLARRGHSLDEWEAIHLGNAIGSLALNLTSLLEPAAARLRLCLLDIEKAQVPVALRSQADHPRRAGHVSLTYDELHEALETIRKRLDSRNGE